MRLKEPSGERLASNAATNDRNARVAGLMWAVGTCAALCIWRTSHWWIAGDDGYYHIRIAADLKAHGAWYFQNLPWTRMSVFSDGWGDKEYLFHLFLIPFAAGDLLLGAKIALAVLNGLTAGLLAYFSVRHAGKLGWLAPLVAVAMTASFPVRLEQLRPHNLSLILLLLVAHAAATRRTAWLIALGTLYALSYTAWQLPIILCVLLFASILAFRKIRRWELLWAPVLGIAVGVLLHPGFPDNVRIWSLQNLQFFQSKDALPVGTEILGRSLTAFALENWRAVALVVLGAAVIRPWAVRQPASDHEIAFGTFAAATTALYLGAQRFAEYAIPFSALYLTLTAARRQGAAPLSTPRFTVLLAGSALGSMMSYRTTATVVRFNHERHGFGSVAEMADFRSALPRDARVAATWDFTPFYYFAAPQVRYLNVLDPIFMWSGHPQEFADLEQLFAGSKVDVPEVLLATLGSDYVAFHRQLFPDLATRVDHDPRMLSVFQSGSHVVARVDTAGSHGLVTDWSLYRTTASSVSAFTAARGSSTAPEIQMTQFRSRGLVSSTAATGCWWAHRPGSVPVKSLGFGSLGPSDVFVDGKLLYQTDVGHAGLIDAVTIEMPGQATKEWVVRSCPHPEYGSGFFLRVQ